VEVDHVPKKIKVVIDTHDIKGVVRGYFTRYEQAGIGNITLFTGWDDRGNVRCVLQKIKGANWMPASDKFK
jgi:hypothetical protein